MKLISFVANGRGAAGLVAGDKVVDLTKRLASHATDVRAILEKDEIREVANLAKESPDYALAEVTLLPVVPRPDKILCVGLNYKKHIAETGRPQPEYPMIFVRFPGSQVGSGQNIFRPRASVQYDYEGELAVVIAKAGRHISRLNAMQHVAGYSCFNDGSVRDFQTQTAQFTAGKNFSKSGSFGPWLVTKDEAGEPEQMTLETRLNGAAVQQSPLSDLIFDVPRLIEYCSTWTELLPGDVIVTGTPSGVGAARKPPVWLKAGDILEVEISGVGLLKNTVQDEPA